MFEYELQQMRSNELIREAQHRRQVREAERARRAAAHDSGENEDGGRVGGPGPRRFRFIRAA